MKRFFPRPRLAGLLCALALPAWAAFTDNGNGTITDIVECGPGKVLTGLLRRTAPEINGHNIFDAASLAAVLEKLN